MSEFKGRIVAGVAVAVFLALGIAGAVFVLSPTPQTGTSPVTRTIVSSVTLTSTPSTTSSSPTSPVSTAIGLALSSLSNNACPTNSTFLSSINYAPLLGNFSQLEISIESSGSLTSVNGSAGTVMLLSSYAIVGTSGSGPSKVYDLTVTDQIQGSLNESLSAAAGVGANGTLDWVDLAGENMTGNQGTETFGGLMEPFGLEVFESGSTGPLISSGALRVINSTTEPMGLSTVAVTNYGFASTPKLTICGNSATFEAFALQTGTLTGSSFTLVTYMDVQGATQNQTLTANFSLQVLSVT